MGFLKSKPQIYAMNCEKLILQPINKVLLKWRAAPKERAAVGEKIDGVRLEKSEKFRGCALRI